MATTVILVRHGETAWNLEQRYQGQEDSPLSDLGLFQARRVGQFLSKRPIAAVYTSDLGRAVQTAQRRGASPAHAHLRPAPPGMSS